MVLLQAMMVLQPKLTLLHSSKDFRFFIFEEEASFSFIRAYSPWISRLESSQLIIRMNLNNSISL